jgi:DNA-binding NarL/FixJ family response regulator
VKACAAGETTFGPSVIARLVDAYVERPEQPTAGREALKELTPRERDVLRSLAKGCPTRRSAPSYSSRRPR